MAEKPSTAAKKTLDSYRQHWEISSQYVEPYFDLGIRLYKLFRGVAPDELDALYTKVNIPFAHSHVMERIPKHLQGIFADPDVLSLDPKTATAEFTKDAAEMWLRDLVLNQLQLKFTLFPTIQGADIFGTGYREPAIRNVNGQSKIVSSDMDFFNVLPAPNGGLVNPLDTTDEAATEWVFKVKWQSEDHIKKNPLYDKNEVRRLIDQAPDSAVSADDYYRDQFANTVGGVVYGGPSTWRAETHSIKEAMHRRRVVYWEHRIKNRLKVIADDKFVLYDGPMMIPNTILLAKYTPVRDLTNWFGISGLELQEDIMIALAVNVNLRLGALIQAMFPIKWIRQDIIGGRSKEAFDTEPNAMFSFPEHIEDIRKAIHYDRAQEAPNQAFLEDNALRFFLQEIGGMPNYSKGMGGGGTLSNETATGIMNLISQANARFFMESEQIEYGGLREECRLLLALGNKFVTNRTRVKNPVSQDGFRWVDIDPEDISDAYDVKTHGTSYLSNKQEQVQRLLAWVNILIGAAQQGGVNVQEVLRQGNQIMDVFPESEKILQPDIGMAGMLGQGMEGALGRPGGMASAQDLRQQTSSVANRTTVDAETGESVPAAFSV